MKEIRVIKTFHIWRNSGKIDNKWIVYGVKDNGEYTEKDTIVQLEIQVKRKVNAFKKRYENAQVRFLDKQKDSKTINKYKVLSEDLKLKLGL